MNSNFKNPLQAFNASEVPLVENALRTSARLDYHGDMKKGEKEPEIITRGGKPVSVILPIAEYKRLLQRLEDAEDAAYLKKARAKTLSFRPLETYLAERRKSGV